MPRLQQFKKDAQHYTLYFDGACYPKNPGGTAAYGWVLLRPDGTECARNSAIVCKGVGATNNLSEWAGALNGIEYYVSLQLRSPLLIYGDSDLVIKQLTGRWRCLKPHLRVYRDAAVDLLRKSRFDWSACWIPRERNIEADSLSHC